MRELKVTKSFSYGGRMRNKGDRIHASNRHADVLIATGKAKILNPEEAEKYNTRHMTSETYRSRPMTAQRTQSNQPRAGRGRRARSDAHVPSVDDAMYIEESGAHE